MFYCFLLYKLFFSFIKYSYFVTLILLLGCVWVLFKSISIILEIKFSIKYDKSHVVFHVHKPQPQLCALPFETIFCLSVNGGINIFVAKICSFFIIIISYSSSIE